MLHRSRQTYLRTCAAVNAITCCPETFGTRALFEEDLAEPVSVQQALTRPSGLK